LIAWSFGDVELFNFAGVLGCDESSLGGLRDCLDWSSIPLILAAILPIGFLVLGSESDSEFDASETLEL
jgi:hypothetical protein